MVTYDSTGLTMVMLCAAGVFFAVAGYEVLIGARGTERLVTLFGATATCVILAIVFRERAWFQFASDTRTVTWRHRWALRQRSGSMPFGSIQSVLVERPIGDEGTPSRRITLRTTDGRKIPIAIGYRPDADGTIVRIASRIRAVLGHGADATHMSNVRALIAAGKTIDAIRVVREEEGLSLVDAKRRVEEIGTDGIVSSSSGDVP